MAWLRDRDARSTTSLVSIIGPRDVAQLEDYLAALDFTLSREQADRLDALSAPSLGVPHGVTASVRDTILGGDATRFTAPTIPVA